MTTHAQQIRRVIAEQLGADLAQVTARATLASLGADEFDLRELPIALEDEFGCGEFSAEEAAQLVTVQAVIAVVERKLAPKVTRPGQRVNVNTASAAELDQLPFIGEAKAQAIIDHRPYAAPRDLLKVPGIKTGTFAKLAKSVAVSPRASRRAAR